MAGLLSRVIPLFYTADEFLHGLQRGVVISETPDNCGEYLFQGQGVRVIVGGILSTVRDDFLPRRAILHIDIGTPCRKLHWAVAIQKGIISCSYHDWLCTILLNHGYLQLQWLWVAKVADLLSSTSTKAVRS